MPVFKSQRISSLDAWTRDRLGLADLSALPSRWREKLTQALSRPRSPFYQRKLAGLSAETALEDLPFTWPEELRRDPSQFLSVSQSLVARAVETSGSTGPVKRFFYSEADLERTKSFFAIGLADIFEDGGRVLVWLSGQRPDSVGDLIRQVLSQRAIETLTLAPDTPLSEVLTRLAREFWSGLVALPGPTQALLENGGRALPHPPANVLLTADWLPPRLRRELAQTWKARVFNHYGLTESGYGGAVDCRCLSGLHLRATDLLWEIIDPHGDLPCPPGCSGEIVLTTLEQEAVPLFRYRTGDLAALVFQPCPCGSRLPRLINIQQRIHPKGG